ncbi:MAG: AlpA family phage regulatory protein [Methylococcales bacterium]|nr:AlpA family phage regulatory protein [Methylococcales bacterium]MDD5631925.1 AlpA family phage regulatory protein [Methylococcales bacterium]
MATLLAKTQKIPKGFLRLWHIIGNPKAEPPIPALIPIGRTSFLNGVKSGKYPKPVKLGERTIAWKVEDILTLIDQLGGAV